MKTKYIVIVLLLFSAGVLLFFSCSRKFPAEKKKLPEVVDYNFHIRPVLSDRCFACHGPDKNAREADLRLDIEEEAYKALAGDGGGERKRPGKRVGTHPIVPGKPEESAVYLRITSEDDVVRMPPPSSNLKLDDYEIKLIEKWIRQGAEYKPHWAFTLPEKTAVPETEDGDWPLGTGAHLNEIDHFVLEKMEQEGLKPNDPADKERLLRRLCTDLTGLPPDVAMMDRFLGDDSPEAYEKMVDELLASPAYGERMAIHWLDVARYADSYGYQDDDIRTQWPWRDWVIHAFNENMPYDEFLTWQLAGDLLPDASKEQVLATAFNRNHKITEEGGVIPEEYRVIYAVDKTNTFSKGVLGITMECAQCHDHKYDPFSQQDYYELYAFFNKSREKGLEGLVGSGPAKTPWLTITQEETDSILDFINMHDAEQVKVSVMEDTVRATHVLKRGVYDAPGRRVDPGTPEAIGAMDTSRYSPDRLGLARWTASKENPLTARVFVNQVWGNLFGRGIVESAGDFGNQGELPSHPELLDWLAVDFMEHGWDIKRLVKQLVMSATYRQSSKVNKKALEKDPDNIYLSRAPRLRLPAELIRDHALASSGLLNREIGGPSVKPYQPEGIWEVTSSGRGTLTHYVQDHGKDLYRRGMYVFIKLTVPPPNMLIFDASNRDQCEVQRLRTNTPLQALAMLNDPVILESSRVLAGKLLSSQQPGLDRDQELQDPPALIGHAFRRVLCRLPGKKEQDILLDYYEKELERYRHDPEAAAEFIRVGEYPQHKQVNPVHQAALMSVIHTLYNLEETVTKG